MDTQLSLFAAALLAPAAPALNPEALRAEYRREKEEAARFLGCDDCDDSDLDH